VTKPAFLEYIPACQLQWDNALTVDIYTCYNSIQSEKEGWDSMNITAMRSGVTNIRTSSHGGEAKASLQYLDGMALATATVIPALVARS